MITDAMVMAAYACFELDDEDAGLPLVRKMLEAAEAAAWQPIETAPIDGTPIMVCRCRSMRWAVWSRDHWRDGLVSHGAHICGVPNPTHWRPLPTLPPNTKEQPE